MGKRRLSAAVLALACAAATAAAALGAGPDPGVSGTGVALAKVRYVATPEGVRTVVRAIDPSGRVLRRVAITGTFGFPRVAFDGTIEGLSADGHTLVLGEPRTVPFRKHSTFAVVDVPKLKLRKVIELKGDFHYDALSPNGRKLYLIEHMSQNNTLQYRVRAYDVAAGRLLKKMVTDKRRWQSVMQGVPVARANSLDRRWAYTLYAGGAHPFVHSLDTTRAYAVCIDLPQRFASIEISNMKMKMRSKDRLVIRFGRTGKTLAVLDTKNFRVLSTAGN